jgi:hypothetical protein
MYIKIARSPERLCYNATMLQCYALFHAQKGPFPSEKSPFYVYVAPNFRQTATATSTPKNGHISSFFSPR